MGGAWYDAIVLCSSTCNSHFILFCFAVLFAFCFFVPSLVGIRMGCDGV